jgi:hypothetical protein
VEYELKGLKHSSEPAGMGELRRDSSWYAQRVVRDYRFVDRDVQFICTAGRVAHNFVWSNIRIQWMMLLKTRWEMCALTGSDGHPSNKGSSQPYAELLN